MVALVVAAGWLVVDVATTPAPAAGEGPALLPAAAPASPTLATAAAEPDEVAVLAAAAAALEDWASFAGSGDLGGVEETFDTAGPQYRQLAAETAITGDSYGLDLGDDPQVTLDGDHARVRTTAAFTTAAGTTTHDWELELRREPEAAGVWRLWTVHETSP